MLKKILFVVDQCFQSITDTLDEIIDLNVIAKEIRIVDDQLKNFTLQSADKLRWSTGDQDRSEHFSSWLTVCKWNGWLTNIQQRAGMAFW